MAHLLTPASEAIWESSGYVITEEGEFQFITHPMKKNGKGFYIGSNIFFKNCLFYLNIPLLYS
jgi:hypothetical protein